MTKVMGPIGILNGCQYYHQMTNEKPFSDWIILAIEISTVELLKIVHYDTDVCLYQNIFLVMSLHLFHETHTYNELN